MNTHITKYPIRFSIIGCGRVGVHLAVFLKKHGFVPTGFFSQSTISARQALDAVGSGTIAFSPEEAAKLSSVVFLTTPDTQIESVCENISKNNGFDENSIVFHLSGALDSSILKTAAAKGASIGSIHPLQAFAKYQAGQESPFKDINMSIEGDEKAISTGRQIVKVLGAKELIIPSSAKTLYHAAAVTSSNYLVTLIHGALQMMEQTGVDSFSAYNILEPLIYGALRNIKNKGTVDGLTGPIARADHAIVSRHITRIREELPEIFDLYRVLGKYTIDLANESGKLNPDDKKTMNNLFKNF